MSGWKMYRCAILLSVLLGSGWLGFARTKAQPVDRDYLAALAVADQFLGAWRGQDEETAILLLDDRLRQPAQEEKLQALFSAAGDRLAYEICRGRRLAAGRYEFPVTLFRVGDASAKWQQPRGATVVVMRLGKNDWLIDKLP